MNRQGLFKLILVISLTILQIKSQEEVASTIDSIIKIEEGEKESELTPPTIEQVKTKEYNTELFDAVKGYRLRSEQEVRFLTEISDMTFLVFYYKPDSVQSQKVAKHLKEIVDRLKDLASVIMIDCTKFSPEYSLNCRSNEYTGDSFPRLKLLIPPEKRYDSFTKEIEVHYEYPWTEKEMNENTIYNFIVSNVPDKAIKLTKNNAHLFLNNDLFNKVVLFTDKSQTSLLWRGITNYFNEKILFGEVFKNDGAELIEQFNVTKFPTLILYKVNDRKRLLDKPEIIKYEGVIESEKIIEWIQPHALLEKRYISQKRGTHDVTAKELSYSIEFKTVNSTNYEEYLNEFPDKNVIFYFNTKNNPKLAIKQTLIHNHGFFISAFFDCEKDRSFCLDKFEVTKFPMLKMIPRIDSEKNITTIEERIKNMKSFDISKTNKVSLEDQIRVYFPSQVQNISSLEFPFKQSQAKFDDKHIIVHFYRDDDLEIDTLPLDLLSQHPEISKYFIFLAVRNPSDEILKMNRVPWRSGIFYFKKVMDEFQIIPVNRDSFYSSLYNIADSILYIERTFKGRPPFHSELVKQIKSSANLRKECLDREFCVLAFFDAKPGKESQEAFNNLIEKLERVKVSSKRFDTIKFNWVNATCHSYLAEKFDINMQELPGVTFYYRSRGYFSTFVGLWDSFTLGEYFERCVNNRYPTKEINREDVYLENRACEQLEQDEKTEESENLNTQNTNENKNVKDPSESTQSTESTTEEIITKTEL